ncbi:MAG: lipopolysaccharide assembly protein LapA domain-containing protein [Humidesulfovibrio sp.]
MRYLKAVLLALLFVVSMLFFVQNNVPLSTSLQLEFNLVTLHLISVPLPVYLFVLAAFLLGVVFSLGFLLVERIRLGLELKALRRQHAALEDEALALRTLPLNQPENKPQTGV